MARTIIEGTVPIVLDRPRNLRFGVNAMSLAEPLLHEDFDAILKGARMSIGDMRALLYACLKWEDARLTLDQVGDLMEAAIIGNSNFYLDTVELIFECVVASGLVKRATDPNAPTEAAPSASANGLNQRGTTPTDH